MAAQIDAPTSSPLEKLCYIYLIQSYEDPRKGVSISVKRQLLPVFEKRHAMPVEAMQSAELLVRGKIHQACGEIE
jgi:hypothetical protein